MKELEMMLDTPEKRSNFITIVSQMETGTKMCGRLFEKDETRRDIQNKLDWHWNREISQQSHEPSKYVHGQSKLEVLLPLMYEFGIEDEKIRKRAEFLDSVFNSISRYEVKVGVAYDMVRSRDLSVAQYATYLTHKEQFWAEKGMRLTTSEDLYFKALGRVA